MDMPFPILLTSVADAKIPERINFSHPGRPVMIQKDVNDLTIIVTGMMTYKPSA